MPSADAMEHWAGAGYSGWNPQYQSWSYYNPPSPYTQAWNNALLGVYGPSVAGVDYQQSLLQQQQRANQAGYNAQVGYLNKDIGYAGRDYNLALQGVDLSREGLLNQQSQMGTNYRLGAQQNINQLDTVLRQMGLQPQLRDIQNQRFGLSEADLRRESERAIAGQVSNATGKGALGSEGLRQGMQYEKSELSDALAGVGLGRREYGIEQGEREAQLSDQEKQLRLDWDKLNAQLTAGNQDMATQWKALDLKAAQAGLSRDQTISKINQAISQLGINLNADANRIALEMAKLDLGLQTSIPSDILKQINYMMGA